MMYLLQENGLWVLGSAATGAAITWFMAVRKVEVAVLVSPEDLDEDGPRAYE